MIVGLASAGFWGQGSSSIAGGSTILECAHVDFFGIEIVSISICIIEFVFDLLGSVKHQERGPQILLVELCLCHSRFTSAIGFEEISWEKSPIHQIRRHE